MPENEPARRLVPQAEAGLGASPHLGAQPGGAGGARRPRRQGVQGPVRAAPGVGDVQPVRLLLEVTDLQLKAYEAAGPVCPF